MSATHQNNRMCLHPPRRGFTLTELLVVIAIIVVLITLLLSALSEVQEQSRKTRTIATIQSFSNAAEIFQQEHGFYPGAVPEPVLANDPQMSSTENALLHLMGGVGRRADFPDTPQGETAFDAAFPVSDGWEEWTFDGSYRIRIHLGLLGEGPIIDGKSYAPYFAPSERELSVAPGQVSAGTAPEELPDLVDPWGQPIIFLRRQRDTGLLAPAGSDPWDGAAQFSRAGMTPYVDATELGGLGKDQTALSIWSRTDAPNRLLEKLLEHPALAGQARGGYVLISAGKDGVYFSRHDGPGGPGDDAVDDLVDADGNWREDFNASVFDDYDDVVMFGGS